MFRLTPSGWTAPATITVTSVSSTSLTPLTPIRISATGFNPCEPILITFANTSGFTATAPPIRIETDGTIVVGVPVYMDVTTGQIASGTVSLTVTQAGQSSAPQTVAIQSLPSVTSYGAQPGQISRAFLNFEAMLIGHRIGELQMFDLLNGNTVDTSAARSSLNDQLAAVIEARNDVDRVMSNSSLVILGPTFTNGVQLRFDATALDAMDRLLARQVLLLTPLLPSSAAARNSASTTTTFLDAMTKLGDNIQTVADASLSYADLSASSKKDADEQELAVLDGAAATMFAGALVLGLSSAPLAVAGTAALGMTAMFFATGAAMAHTGVAIEHLQSSLAALENASQSGSPSGAYQAAYNAMIADESKLSMSFAETALSTTGSFLKVAEITETAVSSSIPIGIQGLNLITFSMKAAENHEVHAGSRDVGAHCSRSGGARLVAPPKRSGSNHGRGDRDQ